MIDLKFINKSFAQKGKVCVLASYSIIMEYFSNKKLPLEEIFKKYNETYNAVNPITLAGIAKKGGNVRYYFENGIYSHFNSYAKNKKMQGSEFIEHIHNGDILKTKSYSAIVDIITDTKYIGDNQRNNLSKKVESIDTMAMILYPSSENEVHCIGIGTDLKNSPFYRDPEKASIVLKDGLHDKEVTEYIVFKKI